MTTIPKGRRMEQAAVNTLRALLQSHDHVVEEISGQNDYGEDLFVTFADAGRVTNDVIKVQVKGGASWRRSYGYAVPVRQHGDTWANGNVPVFCVVFDPDTEQLYWANSTEQLRRGGREGHRQRTVRVPAAAVLDDTTLASFVDTARAYVGGYRGRNAVLAHLGEMAGVTFGPSDHVLHWINEFEEQLIFWQRPGQSYATLLHSDLDWNPVPITPGGLLIPGGSSLGLEFGGDFPEDLRHGIPFPMVSGVILNVPEALWLSSCFSATEWARRGAEAESGSPPGPGTGASGATACQEPRS
ncbi:DUF4365 domain-containing protein [Streptomyces barkulensis]|uniref:DUF4365 domain-containing protein n=1 Tax=Streptomyces barkulensis TaxID=1257026 RepID=UPI001F0FC214|nr:DUF4365 domain-containing protein [Streptomyces barkulensis]